VRNIAPAPKAGSPRNEADVNVSSNNFPVEGIDIPQLILVAKPLAKRQNNILAYRVTEMMI